jgi:hypothetical protein
MSVLWAWVSLVVSVALPPILFLSFAGRWDLWYGWAYAGILAIVFSFNLLSLYFKNPDLLKERMKPPSGLAYWTGPISLQWHCSYSHPSLGWITAFTGQILSPYPESGLAW